MYDKYLVTGATGFLGRAVVEALVRRGTRVYALVLHDDPYINLLPKEVHTVIGDVYNKSFTDFLIIFANLRKCWKGLLYQAFPAFCVSEDTPHIMAYRSLIWRSKVVKP